MSLSSALGHESPTQMGKIADRQSLVFGECSQLLQAILQFHVRTNVTRRNAKRAIQMRTDFLFWGKYDCQRMLVIQNVTITLASDSAITIE